MDDPKDFIRIEVEAAWARKLMVIPLLVNGAALLKAHELRAGMRELAQLSATIIPVDSEFDRVTARVIRYIDRHFGKPVDRFSGHKECHTDDAGHPTRPN